MVVFSLPGFFLTFSLYSAKDADGKQSRAGNHDEANKTQQKTILLIVVKNGESSNGLVFPYFAWIGFCDTR
jgi:hypothetical protein